MYKRGVSELTSRLLQIFVAVVIIIGFLLFGQNIANAFSKQKHNVDCSNANEWKAITSVLDDLQSNSKSGSVFFYNRDCILASFSATQAMQDYKVKPPRTIGAKPELCLCLMDSDNCLVNDCYKLDKFDTIIGPSNSQFTTLNFNSNLILNFIKDGKNLRITIEGDERTPRPLYYKYEQKYFPLDENHLVNEMQVLFKTNQITGYLPIVKLQTQDIPSEVPNSPGLTKYFSVDLTVQPPEGANLNDYKQNPKLIDSNIIHSAIVSFMLPKSSFEGLSQADINKIRLYFNSENSWQSTPMICNLAESNYYCDAILEKGFPREYIISKSSTTNMSPVSPIIVDRFFASLNSPLSGIGGCLSHIEKTYGIPISVMTAITSLESNYGKSKLGSPTCLVYDGKNPEKHPSNNLFSIKGEGTAGSCFWQTHECYTEDEKTKDASLIISCEEGFAGCKDKKYYCLIWDKFRAYNSQCESVEDFAKLIANSNRYKGTLQYSSDPKLMVQKILEAGYSTLPTWAELVNKNMDNLIAFENSNKAVTAPA